MFAGFLDGADNIGSCTRSGDANHCVAVVDIELLKVFPALFGIVLGIFNRVAQSYVAAGDKADDPRGVHAECGGNFRSIEHTETAGSAGTHIEDASAAFHARNYFSDKFFNLRNSFFNSEGHLFVLFVDVVKNFAYRFLFKVVIER